MILFQISSVHFQTEQDHVCPHQTPFLGRFRAICVTICVTAFRGEQTFSNPSIPPESARARHHQTAIVFVFVSWFVPEMCHHFGVPACERDTQHEVGDRLPATEVGSK
jgi:hypothetical protein